MQNRGFDVWISTAADDVAFGVVVFGCVVNDADVCCTFSVVGLHCSLLST